VQFRNKNKKEDFVYQKKQTIGACHPINHSKCNAFSAIKGKAKVNKQAEKNCKDIIKDQGNIIWYIKKNKNGINTKCQYCIYSSC
jgi:hypothetical protein